MNSIFKISFISLLAAMSLFAACKKYDNNQPEINKDIKILSDWLKLNGDKFSKGIINIKESGNTLESRSLDWSQVKKFDSEQNEFFEIPFLSQNTGSLKSGIERNTSAENLYKEYRLIIQKKKSNGILTGRIKISIDGNLGNDALAKKINKIEFFDDLKAKRKRNYFCFTNRILPTRFYEKKISSVDIISNSTSNFPKPQLVRNCIPISVPIIGYVCSGNQIGEDYNVSCGYENIGNRIVEECTDGDEGSDPFDYYGYYGSDPRPTNPSNNPPPKKILEDRINELQKACLKNVVDAIGGNTFTDTLSSLYRDNFLGTGNATNIIFRENTTTLNGPAHSFPSGANDQDWVVEINPNYFNGSSAEYIASVVVHEIIHYYIEQYFIQHNLAGISANYTSHEYMFRNWVKASRNLLVSMYNLPNSQAYGLALGGMSDVIEDALKPNDPNAFNIFFNKFAQDNYGINLVDARAEAQLHRIGANGTNKCN